MDQPLTVFDAAIATFGPLADGVQHVGWSATAAGDGPHLILSALDDDPTPTLLISLDGDQAPAYDNGVTRVEVHSRAVVLHLAAPAAATLDLPATIRIGTPDGTPNGLLAALRELVPVIEIGR